MSDWSFWPEGLALLAAYNRKTVYHEEYQKLLTYSSRGGQILTTTTTNIRWVLTNENVAEEIVDVAQIRFFVHFRFLFIFILFLAAFHRVHCPLWFGLVEDVDVGVDVRVVVVAVVLGRIGVFYLKDNYIDNN